MTVVLGGLTPHAPVLLPEVGRQDILSLRQTVTAMRDLARRVMVEDPDVIIIATPHGRLTQNAFGVYGRETLLGDMAHYAAPQVSFEVSGEPLLARKIEQYAAELGLATHQVDAVQPVALDYGVMVPMYYMQQAGYRGAVMPVTCSNLTREQHRLFGRAIAQAASVLGLRAVLLASGDLSHRLTAEAPAGFSPNGELFDQTLINLLEQGDWQRIFDMDDHLCSDAGQCGYRTLLVLLGALEKSLPRANLLAYEGPFGVGYATVTVDVDDSAAEDDMFDPASYARQVADTFLQTERLPPEPANFPHEARGCFICMKREGQLRMCVGEVIPSERHLAAEIARQTLAALREYAGRHPLNIDDLNHLGFSVDLVSAPEALPALDGHDPRRYGLLVTAEGRRSAVLPGLSGVDTPQQQLAIALKRLGLKPEDRYQLERFESKHYEEQARPAW